MRDGISRDEAFAEGWAIGLRAVPYIFVVVIGLAVLCGCEPASTWSDKQANIRPTDEVRREISNEDIDKREMERGR